MRLPTIPYEWGRCYVRTEVLRSSALLQNLDRLPPLLCVRRCYHSRLGLDYLTDSTRQVLRTLCLRGFANDVAVLYRDYPCALQ